MNKKLILDHLYNLKAPQKLGDFYCWNRHKKLHDIMGILIPSFSQDESGDTLFTLLERYPQAIKELETLGLTEEIALKLCKLNDGFKGTPEERFWYMYMSIKTFNPTELGYKAITIKDLFDIIPHKREEKLSECYFIHAALSEKTTFVEYGYYNNLCPIYAISFYSKKPGYLTASFVLENGIALGDDYLFNKQLFYR